MLVSCSDALIHSDFWARSRMYGICEVLSLLIPSDMRPVNDGLPCPLRQSTTFVLLDLR